MIFSKSRKPRTDSRRTFLLLLSFCHSFTCLCNPSAIITSKIENFLSDALMNGTTMSQSFGIWQAPLNNRAMMRQPPLSHSILIIRKSIEHRTRNREMYRGKDDIYNILIILCLTRTVRYRLFQKRRPSLKIERYIYSVMIRKVK